MSEKVFIKIKDGSAIFQDHGFFRWPDCKPPQSEYQDEEYLYRAKNPDMIFEASWDGKFWDCVRSGYGRLGPYYGNGSIFVSDKDGVEIVPSATFKDTIAPKPVKKHKPSVAIIKLMPVDDHEQCAICNDRCGSTKLKLLVLRDMHTAICDSCRSILKKVLSD